MQSYSAFVRLDELPALLAAIGFAMDLQMDILYTINEREARYYVASPRPIPDEVAEKLEWSTHF
jgi:hypothetical protein